MNRMRENTTTTVSTTTNSADHERNLDALLEDLQTTVSRSNSTMNLNGNVTGYRELRRTYTDGTPEGGTITTNEYQIQYLNPANTTQHLVESSYNGMPNAGAQRTKNVTATYKYNTVESTSGNATGDMKIKQNISELDSLLDDLNTAQKKNFSESTSVTSRNVTGIDPAILDQSTSQSLIRTEQKHYSEDKSLRGRSPSTRRELVFTGQRSQDPSPIRDQMYYEQHDQSPKVQQFYRYEKTTSTRTTGPTITDATPVPEPNNLQSSTVRNYTYTDESPLPLRRRSPSPGGPALHSYQYSSSSSTVPPQSPPLDKYRTLPDDYSTQRQGTSSYTYSSTMRESRNDSRGKTPPPPHRSPSPVSFSQPPPPTRSTTVKTYTYDQHNNNNNGRPHSPLPGQKFSPSDPSHGQLTYNISPIPPGTPPQHHSSTITNYKYSSTTQQHHHHHHHQHQDNDETAPLMPRPFPTQQPPAISPSQHSDQQPPKKLDELMASFSDADQRRNRYTETTVHHYTSNNVTPHPPPQGIILHPSNENEKLIEKEREISKEKEIEKEKMLAHHDESKNVTGPPVYYPPGVELFAKKEESMMQQQSGGGRYRAKAKYEYEAKSKSKMKESSGKAVVPVCLPLCCAMPCVIM